MTRRLHKSKLTLFANCGAVTIAKLVVVDRLRSIRRHLCGGADTGVSAIGLLDYLQHAPNLRRSLPPLLCWQQCQHASEYRAFTGRFEWYSRIDCRGGATCR